VKHRVPRIRFERMTSLSPSPDYQCLFAIQCCCLCNTAPLLLRAHCVRFALPLRAGQEFVYFRTVTAENQKKIILDDYSADITLLTSLITEGQLDFLAVMDTHLTKSAEKANVVIPLAGFASSLGTFTNTEGRMLMVSPAADSPVPFENWEINKEIACIAGKEITWEDEEDISRDMNKYIPAYRNADVGEVQPRSGFSAAAALEEDTDDECYKGKLISPLPTSDHLTRSANRRLGTSVYGD